MAYFIIMIRRCNGELERTTLPAVAHTQAW